MTLTDWLDQAQARADAATEGPWEEWAGLSPDGERRNGISPAADGEVDVCLTPRSAQGSMDSCFIAASRTDLPAAIAALRAVLDHMTNVEAIGGYEHLAYKAIREVIASALGVTQ